ncbi:hypothetical protein [Jeotgalibacillus proteolyticus]|uniref:Uncharacterized protein n=1 Tax=Jeotgalibacillus proteolyticus TaxID=2082395 RepID=A0A2S5GE27_9BACL|nr:hypothetical protein [Jeotgalibacillus proteolyticus]PPA71208.1 hypothetical protein C4B60_03840 [Jeotgalibacillus proteolyticus]
MFDPTAFDNLKTVLEGTIYDRDLDGTISILKRHDLVDIATLSRSYTIGFNSNGKLFEVDMMLKSDLKKLASELLPDQKGTDFAGAAISILFRKHSDSWTEDELEIFNNQWGENRCYELRTVSSNRQGAYSEMIIQFDRTITEEMIDDVEEMVYFTIETIDLLGKGKNGNNK